MKTIYVGSAEISPLGNICVAVSSDGLFALEFPTIIADFRKKLEHSKKVQTIVDQGKTQLVFDQLKEFASGSRKSFDLMIDWHTMADFQRKALEETINIPYGETSTYKLVATKIGSNNGARAVGRAEATNPIPLVIPCHRVLGSDGSLHGYGAGVGLQTKQWLLDLEKNNKS